MSSSQFELSSIDSKEVNKMINVGDSSQSRVATYAFGAISLSLANFWLTYAALNEIWKYREAWMYPDLVIKQANTRICMYFGASALASTFAVILGVLYFRRNQRTGVRELFGSSLVATVIFLDILLLFPITYTVSVGASKGWFVQEP